MPELFETRSGRVIMDEKLSEKMYLIKQQRPESRGDSSSGFEWSEIGMATLFGLVYTEEARYCPEHRSWYTYHEGAWRKDEGAILVSEKMKDFVRLMILYCGEIDDEELRKAYLSFVNRMGDRRMRDRILKDATGELRISAVEFDSDPYLFRYRVISLSGNTGGTISLQCRRPSITRYRKRWRATDGRLSLQKSRRTIQKKPISFKERSVTQCSE